MVSLFGKPADNKPASIDNKINPFTVGDNKIEDDIHCAGYLSNSRIIVIFIKN